jgi:putative transposase
MTVRAYGDQIPFRSDDLNRAVINLLREESEGMNCLVFTYCLMPDHLHFLVSPKFDGVCTLAFTDRYKGKATNGSWKVGWQGKLWQPRSHDHVVRREESLRAIADYIRANPVRQGLVEYAEQWPWSGEMNPLPGW